MSNEEHNETMRNVRWTTFIYTSASAASILLAIAGMYWGLKGDIKDNRVTSHIELNAAVDSIKMSEQRTQQMNELNFQSIWNEIKNIENKTPASKIIYRYKQAKNIYFTERKDPATGKISYIPIE
ncbi:MAG: hypothetical protein JWQ09_5860 [Segetibacter sp.]|nr:hypothetical protein [Segetibacter sp.]